MCYVLDLIPLGVVNRHFFLGDVQLKLNSILHLLSFAGPHA